MKKCKYKRTEGKAKFKTQATRKDRIPVNKVDYVFKNKNESTQQSTQRCFTIFLALFINVNGSFSFINEKNHNYIYGDKKKRHVKTRSHFLI